MVKTIYFAFPLSLMYSVLKCMLQTGLGNVKNYKCVECAVKYDFFYYLLVHIWGSREGIIT